MVDVLGIVLLGPNHTVVDRLLLLLDQILEDERAPSALSGLHEPVGEAIGLALDRGIEHLDRVQIVLVREHGAFRGQYEAGRLHLLADARGSNLA